MFLNIVSFAFLCLVVPLLSAFLAFSTPNSQTAKMRVSTSISAILALAMSALPVAQAGGRLGFALGVKQPNGNCKVQGDYEADMDAIAKDSGSKIIRIYDAAECDVTAQMLPAAKNKGFQAILGIWYVKVPSHMLQIS